MEKFSRVCVVGTGVMGRGITQTCSLSGYDTVLIARGPEELPRAMADIQASLSRQVERGRLTEQAKDEALARIEATVNFDAAQGCDIVIEAIMENLDVKRDIFRRLDRLCSPETILASDTATLPIEALARATGRPDKVVGLHILSPAPASKVVELVRTELCSEATVERAQAFCESLGKTVVVVQDSPGFIINRLLVPGLLEAVRLLEQGVATKEDIDTCMQLGCGHPVGPLRLLDLVGLDQFLDLATSLNSLLGDPKYEPPRLLQQMVEKGLLGQKSGRGFYHWRR